MDQFKALLITRDEATKQQSVGEAMLTPDDLMEGDVDIRVEHSTVNYKDGLAITGKLPVVRRFPMIPGVDLAGTVIASRHAEGIAAGDKVIVNGWGLGETHYGAYSQMARVEGSWITPLPPATSPPPRRWRSARPATPRCSRSSRWSVTGSIPTPGPVIVTGASGGVGSMAVALLSRLGYRVAAVTGKATRARLPDVARRRRDHSTRAELRGAAEAARQGALGRRDRCGRRAGRLPMSCR